MEWGIYNTTQTKLLLKSLVLVVFLLFMMINMPMLLLDLMILMEFTIFAILITFI